MTSRIVALAALLVLIAGCSEDKAPDATLCLDRLSVKLVYPAGIKVEFRLLDCDGNPVRQLTPNDVSVINDEKGLPFGQGGEGDSISDIGENSAIELYSVLTLDLSNSIGEDELRDAVIDGAKAFVQAVITNQSGALRHNVAIIAFGAPTQVTVEQDFTQDDAALNAKLEELRTSPMRGSTDLYGAYTLALDTVAPKGASGAIVERFVVLMTDGTHEAGDEANRREAALNRKNATEATVYSIGIQGNYDSCKLEELAGYQDKGGCRVGSACVAGTAAPAACINFISDVSQANLEAAFSDVADKAAALARSNYAVGICTPVAFGNPSLTLELSVDGRTASETAVYSAGSNLNGDVNQCDSGEIQGGKLLCSPPGPTPGSTLCNPVCVGMVCGTDQLVSCGTCPERFVCNGENQCDEVCVGMQCGADQGAECGSCGAQQICSAQDQCEDVCIGMTCGMDQGVSCGSCSSGDTCGPDNTCSPPCTGMDCGTDNGVSCGTCSGQEFCGADNVCRAPCENMGCGTDQAVSCGSCPAQHRCMPDNTCLEVCVGIACGLDQGVLCGPCSPGSDCVNPDVSAASCEAILCELNHYVNGNACQPCPSGWSNDAGDDASGLDTSCSDACTLALGLSCAEFSEAVLAPQESDDTGPAVALSGNTLVIGVQLDDSTATGVNGSGTDTALDSGAAYVFVRNGGIWTQEAYIKASNTDAGDLFGISVAVDGDTLVVGAQAEQGGSTGVNGDQGNAFLGGEPGAAYVFTRTGAEWSQQAYLKASNTQLATVHFGNSLALAGDTLAIGAFRENSNATGVDGNQADSSMTGAGAVYVFQRTGGDWAQQAYIKASNTNTIPQKPNFGHAIALSGDTLAVSAPWESSNATGVDGDQFDTSMQGSGAVYVFTRTGVTWAQQAYIKAEFTDASAGFGYSLALDADTLAVGAINESAFFGYGYGATYVFTRSGTQWSQQAHLLPSVQALGATASVGRSTAVSGDRLIVGASGESSPGTGFNGDGPDLVPDFQRSGALYVFERVGANWSQIAFIKPFENLMDHGFGLTAALDGTTAAVGAATGLVEVLKLGP